MWTISPSMRRTGQSEKRHMGKMVTKISIYIKYGKIYVLHRSMRRRPYPLGA